MIKTNIKMRVAPEQSKKVQEICFANGVFWPLGANFIKHTYSLFIYIGDDNELGYGNSGLYFKNCDFKEVNADLFIRTNGTCEEKPKNNFEEFGFAADFEGEILKQVSDRILIGYVINKKGNYTSQKWSITGASQEGKYNLTPIKKEWYENKDNFPCLVYEDDYVPIVLVSIDEYKERTKQGYKHIPATKEEVLKLIVDKDK